MRKFHIVIVGAAPSGLYLANKLVEAGIPITEILVCDPKAGQYIRPGHIQTSTLAHLSLAGDPVFKIIPGKSYHIKDVERTLFQLALDKAIPIENNTFIGFITIPGKTGILVRTSEGEEIAIECDYLFDCTGLKRTIIQEVNLLAEVNHPPFFVLPVAAYAPVTHYVLAYLTMAAPDLALITASYESLKQQELHHQTPLEFSQHMKKLQRFGWNKEFYPQYIVGPFGNHKACFYSEAPEGLRAEDLINWVKTVVTAITNNPHIDIKPVKPSVKYGEKKDKLRLMHFNVDLNYLNRLAYHHPGLPIVIPQGDAVHAPLFLLGFGISFAVQRINAFIKTLLITDGNITHFDENGYTRQSEHLIIEQCDKQLAYLEERTLYFYNSLDKVSLFYQQAIEAAQTGVEHTELQEKLQQINQLKLNYDTALQFTAEELAQLEPSFAAEIMMIKKALAHPKNSLGPIPQQKQLTDFNTSWLYRYQELEATEKREQFNYYLKFIAEILRQDTDPIEVNPERKIILSMALSSVIKEFDQEYKENKLFFILGILTDPTIASVCRSILQYQELVIAEPLKSDLGETAIQILGLIEQELSEDELYKPPRPRTAKLSFFDQPQKTAEANQKLQPTLIAAPPPTSTIELIYPLSSVNP